MRTPVLHFLLTCQHHRSHAPYKLPWFIGESYCKTATCFYKKWIRMCWAFKWVTSDSLKMLTMQHAGLSAFCYSWEIQFQVQKMAMPTNSDMLLFCDLTHNSLVSCIGRNFLWREMKWRRFDSFEDSESCILTKWWFHWWRCLE